MDQKKVLMLDAQLRAKGKQSYFLHELMTQRTGNDMEDITYRSAVARDEVVNNSLKAKLSQQVHWLAFPQASPEDVTGQCVAYFPAGCSPKVPAQHPANGQ